MSQSVLSRLPAVNAELSFTATHCQQQDHFCCKCEWIQVWLHKITISVINSLLHLKNLKQIVQKWHHISGITKRKEEQSSHSSGSQPSEFKPRKRRRGGCLYFLGILVAEQIQKAVFAIHYQQSLL